MKNKNDLKAQNPAFLVGDGIRSADFSAVKPN